MIRRVNNQGSDARSRFHVSLRCAGRVLALALASGPAAFVSPAAAQSGPPAYPVEPSSPVTVTPADEPAPPDSSAGETASPPSAEPPAIGALSEPPSTEPPPPPKERIVLLPAPAPPRPIDPDKQLVSNRELGGHQFPLAVFVPPALTFSYFGVRAGLEYHSVPGYSRDLSFFNTAEYSRTNLETVNAAETIDVAIQLHDYIALVGSGYGLARIGANVPTLLGTGADYTYGGDVGLLLKLFRVAGFQLALRGEAGFFAGQQAGIIELFQDIGAIVQTNINDLFQTTDIRQIDLPQRLADIENSIRVATTAVLTPFRGFEYGASLNAAQALGSAFGLQLSFGVYGKAETYDIPVFNVRNATVTADPRDVSKYAPRLGVAFDVNLDHVLMPLDLMAEYTLTWLTVRSDLPDGVTQRVWKEHVIALGGYFSGALNLQLGVIAYILYGKDPVIGAMAEPSGQPLDVGAQFVFRYTR